MGSYGASDGSEGSEGKENDHGLTAITAVQEELITDKPCRLDADFGVKKPEASPLQIFSF
jgi:hypothetical protein